MFGLENSGETLIFMPRHFDETMTILIWCTKILTGDYFVLRINQIIYSKQKIGYFFFFFPSTFLKAVFPIHFVQGGVQVAHGQNYILASK